MDSQPGTAGKWCLGHGVVGHAESLRNGHYVEAHLVPDVFSINTHGRDGGKGLATGTMPRCAICRSIRRWHDHHGNALRRARDFRREHAQRWVDKGIHPTVDAALLEMDVGGVTEEAVAALILEAIGEPCPGLCAHEEQDEEGVHRLVFHTIDRVADLHVDVRDPHEPFSLENIGILCISCNPAKGSVPWARFIYRRRAALRAWQAAIDSASYRRPEQLGFDV
jgi:hypothetical protein